MIRNRGPCEEGKKFMIIEFFTRHWCSILEIISADWEQANLEQEMLVELAFQTMNWSLKGKSNDFLWVIKCSKDNELFLTRLLICMIITLSLLLLSQSFPLMWWKINQRMSTLSIQTLKNHTFL